MHPAHRLWQLLTPDQRRAAMALIGLMLITKILVLLGISAMLLAVAPIGAVLVVSTLTAVGWGFNRVASNHSRRRCTPAP